MLGYCCAAVFWWQENQTSELLREKCYQTLRVKLHFYGKALAPAKDPLFEAVPLKEVFID